MQNNIKNSKNIENKKEIQQEIINNTKNAIKKDSIMNNKNKLKKTNTTNSSKNENKENRKLSIKTKLKLQTAKLGTNLSLAILSNPLKNYQTNVLVNIPYIEKKNKKEINDLQYLDMYAPKNQDKKLPIIFFIHGGAWSSGDKAFYSEYCQKLCECGYIIANINYRLLPDNNLHDIINDCKNAIKFVLKHHKEYGVDNKNIFIIGDSAGAHITALIAGQWTKKETKISKKIRALGLYYGAYDLSTFVKAPFPILRTLDNYFSETQNQNLNEYYKKYSPITYLSSKFPPCILIDGKVDKIFEQSENFIKYLENFNIEYTTKFFAKAEKQAMHGFLNFINSKPSIEAFKALTIFFSKHIKL